MARSWAAAPHRRSVTAHASLLAGSAVIALGVSNAVNTWYMGGHNLRTETDIVGYPTFANYNIEHYTELFILAAVVFPLVLGLSFVAFELVVPRLLARFSRPGVVEASGVVGRVAVPGFAFGLVTAVSLQLSRGRAGLAVAAVTVAYAAGVAVLSVVVAALRPGHPALRLMAALNAALVPALVLSLVAVSAATTVTVTSTGDVNHHAFLPWPVAAAGTVVLGAVVVWRLRRLWRRPLDELRRFEWDVVTLVAGSVIVWFFTARLTGALGGLDAFHEGEGLATATLLRHGAFPWRDLVFIHGPLYDALSPLVGLGVFENSRWGMDAGTHIIMLPLCFVALWVLLTRVVRNWVILAAFPLALLAGNVYLDGLLTSIVSLRLFLLPLIVLLLLRAVRSDGWLWSFGLGVMLVAAFVLTPELAFGVVAAGVVVIGYELIEGGPRPWRQRFRRTLGCLGGGAAAATVFLAWLAWNGAVDDYLFYFRTFAPDHELTGGFRVDPTAGANYVFAAVLPWALALAVGAYFAWRLATRTQPRASDWAMASLAVLGILYYPKFLARADGHVFGGIAVGFALLVYILARVLEPGDRDLESAAPGRAPAHLLSFCVVGALVATAVGPALGRLSAVPDRFQASSDSPVTSPLMGYASSDALWPGLVDDLGVAIGALGPGTRVFDFTNQPAIVHFLLGQPAVTRYPHVSMAIREAAQADLIDQLAEDQPELVIYWSEGYGLDNWDGIVNPVRHYDVSQWLLEHYRPWMSLQGDLLYVRNDLDPPDPATLAPSLSQAPIVDDLIDRVPQCQWGTSPMFLDSADQVGTDGLRVQGIPIDREVTVTGWAGSVAGAPASRLLALDPAGRVLAEVATNGPRPELSQYAPDGVGTGYAIVVPLEAGLRADQISLVAVNASGVAAPVAATPAPAAGTSLVSRDGHTAVLAPLAPVGAIETQAETSLPAGGQTLRLDLPAGATEDYDWVELSTGGEPAKARYLLTNLYQGQAADAIAATTGPGIQFDTFARAVDRYLVQVGACAQWRGFAGTTVYLRTNAPGDVTLTVQRSVRPLG